jgi:hypothetical protein
VNYCCQIRVSGPQDLERDAGTAPFVAVRRNHVVPSRPLVYLSRLYDGGVVVCFVLCGWDVWCGKKMWKN